MSKTNDDEINELLVKVQELLEKRIEFYNRIEDLGLSLQEKGKKLVEFARAGKQYTQYQIDEAPKIAEAITEFPEFNITLTRWHNSSNNINSYLSRAIDDLKKSSDYVDLAYYGVSSATASGSADVESSVTDITLVQTEHEDVDIYGKYDFQIPTALNREYMISELDFELRQIDEKLAIRREGAWDAFNSPSRDKKLQAASSMRQILRTLISKWASDDDVKNAYWWKNQKKKNDKVVLKERLRFLLFGIKEISDEFILIKINEQIDLINKSDNRIQEIAHGSDKTIELVESTMKLIEDTIYSMLIIRKLNL